MGSRIPACLSSSGAKPAKAGFAATARRFNGGPKSGGHLSGTGHEQGLDRASSHEATFQAYTHPYNRHHRSGARAPDARLPPGRGRRRARLPRSPGPRPLAPDLFKEPACPSSHPLTRAMARAASRSSKPCCCASSSPVRRLPNRSIHPATAKVCGMLLPGLSAPLRPREAIEDMRPKGTAGRNMGMLECFPVMLHPDALHHCPGPLVQHRGEGHNLLQIQPLEADTEHTSRRFGRISLPPVRSREPPPDLDTREEWQWHAGHV